MGGGLDLISTFSQQTRTTARHLFNSGYRPKTHPIRRYLHDPGKISVCMGLRGGAYRGVFVTDTTMILAYAVTIHES
jgi:hypothetical protein